MKHLDLFSGIGGFALATEMVFGKEDVEHIFCDNEPFSQAILKKHWPNSYIHDDIKTLTNARCEHGAARRSEGTQEKPCERCVSAEEIKRFGRIDLLTGGFPCQPFSAAGRRAGTADDRHLWPEMLRVIRETNPTYVLGENVGGLLTWDGGLVLEMVLADLEKEGYEAGAFVIPAAAIGAPHRRDRVWIAARNTKYDGQHGSEDGKGNAARSDRNKKGTNQLCQSQGANSVRETITDPPNPGQQKPRQAGERKLQAKIRERLDDRLEQQDRDASDSSDKRLEGSKPEDATRHGGQPHRNGRYEGGDWSQDWPAAAARLCSLDDGLPNGLARPKGWRNAALKGAGNAIVPQVAAEVIRAMMRA